MFGRWSFVLAVRKSKGHVKNKSQACGWRLEKAGVGGRELGFGYEWFGGPVRYPSRRVSRQLLNRTLERGKSRGEAVWNHLCIDDIYLKSEDQTGSLRQ